MKTSTGAQVDIFENVAALAEAFARELSALAARRIEKQGQFNLALTGGETPGPLYERLAQYEIGAGVDWSRVKVFWGDERAVGPDDPASNFKLAWDAWLRKSAIPREAIFRMEGEDEDLAQAAERYGQLLTREVPSGPSGFPALDLILFGLGPDGHVASLFPGTEALDETLRVAVANEVPQLDSWRLTLTYPTINAAHEIWFLVTGEQKAAIVAKCLGVHPASENLPAAMVHTPSGHVRWWLDRAAASLIEEYKHIG